MKCEELIINWLNDAYAMENVLVKLLEKHINDAEEQGEDEVAQKLRQHLEETKQLAENIKMRIEELGGKVSELKSGIAGIIRTIQSLATQPTEDEVVKNTIIEYSLENMERATFKTTAMMAEECGDEKTAEMCRSISDDNEKTAQILDNNLKGIVTSFVDKVVTKTEV